MAQLADDFWRGHGNPVTMTDVHTFRFNKHLVENGMGVSLVPRAGLWLQRPTRLRVIQLGALTFHRELVALLRRAQRQPALDCLLGCLESIN